MVKELSLSGYNVVITIEEDLSESKLIINGTEIPLVYSSGFRGWNVPHVFYSYYYDLELIAKYLIHFFPDLNIDDSVSHDIGK